MHERARLPSVDGELGVALRKLRLTSKVVPVYKLSQLKQFEVIGLYTIFFSKPLITFYCGFFFFGEGRTPQNNENNGGGCFHHRPEDDLQFCIVNFVL
jgi:hypothetical protein